MAEQLDLLRMARGLERIQNPVIERAMIFELESADGMRDPFFSGLVSSKRRRGDAEVEADRLGVADPSWLSWPQPMPQDGLR